MLIRGDIIHLAKLHGYFNSADSAAAVSRLPWPLAHVIEAISRELRRAAELVSVTARQRLFPVFWVYRAANPRWYMLDEDGFYCDHLLLAR